MYKKTLLIILLLFLILGCSGFKTVKSPDKDFYYSELYNTEEYDNGIIFYGDSQKHHDIHMEMVSNIMSFDPNAVFHLGDMVSEGDNKEDWVNFDTITRNLRNQTKFYPVIGNHEKGVNPEWYFNHWDYNIGSGYYSVYLDNQGIISSKSNNNKLQLIVLHSNPGYFTKGEDQYNWLINELEKNPSLPKILVFHIPLYMVGIHNKEVKDNHPSKELYKIVENQKNNIITCISGHDRAYQNFFVDGVYHIVTGDSGETPNKQIIFSNTNLNFFKATYNFTILNLKEDFLIFTVFDRELKIIDKFEVSLN